MKAKRVCQVVAVVGAVVVLAACTASRSRPASRWNRQFGISPRLGAAGPRSEVLDLAVRAFDCGRAAGHFEGSMLTVIDYSLPSTERRLWVIDRDQGSVLFNEYVAHGQGSGDNYAFAFSNEPGSHQSSLGLFRTEQTYWGRHGRSLRLAGLEWGVNDRAEERAIVIHGAPYVSDGFVAEHGRLGRSWGCPALPLGVHDAVIDRIQGGTAVFAYYPDPTWLADSAFLRCDGRVARR